MIITVLGLEIVLEKNNKKYFFVYISFQTVQALFGLIYTIYILFKINVSAFDIRTHLILLSLLSEIFFNLMLLSLIFFHVYLVINNLTTWETLSWNKISYMRVWPRKYGSPFNWGIKKNLRLYFWKNSKSNFINWKMPKKLPSIQSGEQIISNRKFSYLFEKVCIKWQ